MSDCAMRTTLENEDTSGTNSRESFDQWFTAHWPRLLNVLTRVTRNRAQAEEVAQDAFLRLYRRRSSIRNREAWLYRVAVRLALNAIRSERRRTRWETCPDLPTADASRLPDSELQAQEQRAFARQALALMRKRSAQILLLRYSGLSFAEVAAIVEISRSSVGRLLERAEREFEKRYLQLTKGSKPAGFDTPICI